MLKKIGLGNLITFALAIVLIIAGVLNFRYNKAEDSKEKAKILGEAAYVNNSVTVPEEQNSFEAIKLEKEKKRDESIEILREITANPKSSENQIAEANEKLTLIAFYNETEANCEAVLRARGILDDVLVTVDNDSAVISVNADDLTPTQITTILEIVKEQTDFSADKIKISANR